MPQTLPKTHDQSALKGKPVSDSHVIMTEIVLPSHTNQLGSIFGGQIMSWIDIAAAISASRHARSVCVTASIDALNFLHSVRLGQFVAIKASVNYTGKTSMEVGVRIESEDPRSGQRTHVATAYLTFVAVDDNGKPQPVPRIIPKTPDEMRRFGAAELRRESRLKLKADLESKEQESQQ